MKTSAIALAVFTAAITFTATTAMAQVSGLRLMPRSPIIVTHREPNPKPIVVLPDPYVCFYSGINQTRGRFCTTQVGVFKMSANWRNSIKSVRVDHGAIKLCDSTDLLGQCEIYSDDIDRLPPGLFNKVRIARIRK